jgi:hypothetical protein
VSIDELFVQKHKKEKGGIVISGTSFNKNIVLTFPQLFIVISTSYASHQNAEISSLGGISASIGTDPVNVTIPNRGATTEETT